VDPRAVLDAVVYKKVHGRIIPKDELESMWKEELMKDLKFGNRETILR
jgi:hypothetical protein